MVARFDDLMPVLFPEKMFHILEGDTKLQLSVFLFPSGLGFILYFWVDIDNNTRDKEYCSTNALYAMIITEYQPNRET
jgi:hypothetical protein